MKNRESTLKALCSTALLSTAFALLMTGVPVYASSMDESIESAAKESYIFKNYLRDDTITVDSQKGVVTLTGFVSEDPHKALAEETVASLAGVKSVDNKLQIKDETARNEDALISARVVLELLSHRNLGAAEAYVTVKNGVVTVRGEATSQAQIDLTTEYIKDVDGVKDVNNEMGVPGTGPDQASKTIGEKAGDVGKKIGNTAGEVGKKIGVTAGDVGRKIGYTAGNVGESIDDASITALVKATLMYHRSTSALHTRVDTRDGVVTLAGIAKNASAKDLATKFVQDVHGVKNVVNAMTLEEAK